MGYPWESLSETEVTVEGYEMNCQNEEQQITKDCTNLKAAEDLELTALCDLWLRAAFVPEKWELINVMLNFKRCPGWLREF